MINFAPAKLNKMVEIIVICTLIIAIAMAFLCIKLFFKRNGSFTSQHIHDSEAMRRKGIGCVLSQDVEMRRKRTLAVDERTRTH